LLDGVGKPTSPNFHIFTNLEALRTLSFGVFNGRFLIEKCLIRLLTLAMGSTPNPSLPTEVRRVGLKVPTLQSRG